MLPNFTVIYDACVLFPNVLRDLLMELAMRDLYRAKWSSEIHDEWIRNVHQRKGIPLDKLNRIKEKMNEHVRDCLVTDYHWIIPNLNLPDPGDRHVLAAAIKYKSGVIVTANLKDFPSSELERHDIKAQHQDTFISNLIDLDSLAVIEAVKTCRQRRRNPPCSLDEYLIRLQKQELPTTVSMLKELI